MFLCWCSDSEARAGQMPGAPRPSDFLMSRPTSAPPTPRSDTHPVPKLGSDSNFPKAGVVRMLGAILKSEAHEPPASESTPPPENQQSSKASTPSTGSGRTGVPYGLYLEALIFFNWYKASR